jgi:hypothetical protein
MAAVSATAAASSPPTVVLPTLPRIESLRNNQSEFYKSANLLFETAPPLATALWNARHVLLHHLLSLSSSDNLTLMSIEHWLIRRVN